MSLEGFREECRKGFAQNYVPGIVAIHTPPSLRPVVQFLQSSISLPSHLCRHSGPLHCIYTFTCTFTSTTSRKPQAASRTPHGRDPTQLPSLRYRAEHLHRLHEELVFLHPSSTSSRLSHSSLTFSTSYMQCMQCMPGFALFVCAEPSACDQIVNCKLHLDSRFSRVFLVSSGGGGVTHKIVRCLGCFEAVCGVRCALARGCRCRCRWFRLRVLPSGT